MRLSYQDAVRVLAVSQAALLLGAGLALHGLPRRVPAATAPASAAGPVTSAAPTPSPTPAPAATAAPAPTRVPSLTPTAATTGRVASAHVGTPRSDEPGTPADGGGGVVTRHARVVVPEGGSACVTGSALPAPSTQQPVDHGGDDVREVEAQGDQVVFSVMNQSGAVRLQVVGTPEGPSRTSPPEGDFLLLDADRTTGWGVDLQHDEVVGVDLSDGSQRVDVDAAALAPADRDPLRRQQPLTVALAGPTLYVLGTEDPRAPGAVLWLAGVDARTGAVRWSTWLAGLGFPGWSYVPHVGLAVSGADAVVAVLDGADALAVRRIGQGGALVAASEVTFQGGTVSDAARVVTTREAVFVTVSTPRSDDDHDTSMLLRFDLALRLTASQPTRAWNVHATRDEVLVDQWDCDGIALLRYDGRTLAPLGAFALGRSGDLDVHDDTLWLFREDASLTEGTVLTSYRW